LLILIYIMNQTYFTENAYLCSRKARETPSHLNLTKLLFTMTFYKHPIRPMVGRERELMSFFLKQVKQWSGLTSALETTAGMNGKWINPQKPYEIDATKMMRLLFVKALYQDEEEYASDALAFRQAALDFCKSHNITIVKKKKRKVS